MSAGAKFLTALLILGVIAYLAVEEWPPEGWNGDADPVSLTSIEQLVEHGDVEGEHEVPVGSTEPVTGGDTIRLGGEGEATIDYSKFVRVRLFRDTFMQAVGEFNPDEPNARMRVEQGTLVASILTPEAAERLVAVDIQTDVATIRALGTEFFVYVDPTTGATWVIVSDGAVIVDGAGGSVSLVAGTQTWVEPGEQPVEPLPATREAVGNRFPPISTLTGAALSDDDWLRSDDPPGDVSAPVIDAFEFYEVTISGETPQRVVRVEVVASDPGSGVAQIVMQVDGDIARTCSGDSCDTTIDSLEAGEHHADVLVRDGAGNVAEARRTLLVERSDEPPIALISSPREATDLSRQNGTFDVLLDAGMSLDPDGDDLTYSWTVERLDDGVVLQLDPVVQGTASFTQVQPCDSTWTYRFTLTVVDASGMSDDVFVDIEYPYVC